MSEEESLMPRHGGYRNLKTYALSELIYDVTVRFCSRYIDRRSRTHDQMVQAARSGAQNIAEGSELSGTSKKMELKLTNVAKASLAELRLDYEGYLRQKGLRRWERNDARRKDLIDRKCRTVEEFAGWVHETRHCRVGSGSAGTRAPSDEVAANGALTLLDVNIVLLGRQVASQADSFEKHGGMTERMYRVRSEKRKRGD